MGTAFDEEALWNKSKVYVDKALQARDQQDNDAFHLWAAISLELVGKAALAHIHPALVADPTDIKSLLAACGVSTTPQLKSVTAKTVFERLKSTHKEFDGNRADECMKMMNRRNAELHSGESPIVGLDQRAWVPVFWRNVAIILAIQGRVLSDWLDNLEATRVEAIIANSAETGRQAVLARIERRRSEFDARSPEGTPQRDDAVRRANQRPAPVIVGDFMYKQVECPSCGLPTWLEGEEWNREIIDSVETSDDGDFGGYFDVVSVTYGVEAFDCPECNLVLRGQEEIGVAQLPQEFTLEMEDEPDYEPDFGND